MGKRIELTGQRFGRLTVLSQSENDKYGNTIWLCQCECGNEKVILANSLRRGRTKSCGCLRSDLRRESSTTHGMKGTRTYRCWQGMKARCYNKNVLGYKNYGARGITVCERWRDSIENFCADMGPAPKGLTLERLDNNKGYSPENCKWATRKEQNRNSRHNRMICYGGRTLCLAEWAEELGVKRETLRDRLKIHPPQFAFNM